MSEVRQDARSPSTFRQWLEERFAALLPKPVLSRWSLCLDVPHATCNVTETNRFKGKQSVLEDSVYCKVLILLQETGFFFFFFWLWSATLSYRLPSALLLSMLLSVFEKKVVCLYMKLVFTCIPK